MLVAFRRVSASLRLPAQRVASPKTRFANCPRLRTLLATRPNSTAMFKQAVNNHTAPLAAPKPSSQQQSLINSFKNTATTQNHNTRPLSLGSGNIARDNTERRTSPGAYATKRASTGLAKALASQEVFDYSGLKVSETGKAMSGFNPSHDDVYFDEDDFSSDIDLDLEDLAAKATVPSSTLPATTTTKDATVFGDSAYGSSTVNKQEFGSSAPIPWSSSPVEHFRTAPKAAPAPKAQPTKRRTLPWLQSQTKAAEENLESELESDSGRPRKRKATQANLTPAPKGSAKSQYAWNTTASTMKEQQKKLREQNKKINKGTEDEVNSAIERKKKNNLSRIFLSQEQQQVLSLVCDHQKSVFFTGSAGTGKSVLLREIISTLRKKHLRDPDRIAVTASTGLAACNIGGVTLHSFAGIGLGKEPAEELVKKVKKHNQARQRWLRTRVLIIDEISMVDGALFDKLEQIARTLRNSAKPFGGIQLIITGDFFQLPPVAERGTVSRFAFDAGTWTTTIEHTIGLHHVFRQKDPVFANMLNEMREGRMSQDSIAKFKALNRPLPKSETEENIEATELFPTRAEVDRANNLRMQQLHGDMFDFDARDGGSIADKTMRDKLLDKCMAPQRVSLKKGAQVMLIKNMDDTLVNGSLGKVTGFMTEQMFSIYKEDEEAFLDGERIAPTETEVRAQQAASVLGVNTQQVYPIVRFSIADGTTRDLLCKREAWKYELPNGEVQASREQIPLILAWALSIHKAQGQTLERVRVDLGRAFEKGQAYVALSRATTMGGLQVMRFDPSKVMAHEKVRTFYQSLSRAEQTHEDTMKKTILGKMQTAQKKKTNDYEQDFVDR